MSRKLKPYTAEEHEKFAKDIKQAVDIISPHLESLWKRYGINSSQAKAMLLALKHLSSKLPCKMDNAYHEIDESEREGRSPYFNSGITHY